MTTGRKDQNSGDYPSLPPEKGRRGRRKNISIKGLFPIDDIQAAWNMGGETGGDGKSKKDVLFY